MEIKLNINKINDVLQIKVDKELDKELDKEIESQEEEISVYTKNPDLIKEIDKYKSERLTSIGTLVEARDNIMKILSDNGKAYLNSITMTFNPKDIDAYSKLLNTLTNVVQKIDDLSNPQKVETYIEPTKKSGAVIEGTFNQNNIFCTNPADLVKIMKENIATNEE
jgi:hypothetical protein